VKFQESLDVLSQGTGIGLSLCERLVELMEVDIYLDESYDSGVEGCPGARFVLNMKIPSVNVESLGGGKDESGSVKRCATSLTADNSSSSNRCAGAGELPEELSILFVDDDMLLRKLFTRSLHKHFPNWTVMEAGSGESALSIVESQDFDLIFLDQYMTSAEKQLLGSEAARALRTKGCTSVICGLSANDTEQKFMLSGSNAFVMKPFPCKKEPMIQELKRILCGTYKMQDSA
jgi:CheY-like chemotaxis protein